MTTTYADVLRAIEAWQLESIVEASNVKGKAILTYDGTTAVYPYWLAVRKIGMIGADHLTL